MLIQALCNYYDILSAEGKVLPEGYSKVKIHYLISLTEEGTIDNIINVQREIADKECIFNCNKRFKNLWLQFFLSQNQGFMRLFEKTVLK